VKLSFQNGERRRYVADRSNKGYLFTDKIFANGWLTDQRTKPQGSSFEAYNPCGQGIEFANGFSIGKIQLYRESEPFYESKVLQEIVFENEQYRITKECEWSNCKLHFDKGGELYRVLLPGAYAFNRKCLATFALNDGRRATSLDFNYMSSFNDGLCLVCVAGHGYGYVDKNLDFVIPPQFNRAGDFVDGFAGVALWENEKDRWFFIDKTGKEITFKSVSGAKIEGKYKIVSNYSEGLARVSTIEKPYLAYHSDNEDYAGIWGYVDSQGVEIVSPRYIYAMDFKDGLAEVCKGEWTIDKKWDNKYHSGAFWTEEELWGFIDGIGREVVPCVFDELKRFWSDRVCSEIDPDYFGAHFGGWKYGKWGIIDRTGKWVVEPIFDDLGYDISSEGWFQFYGGNKWEHDGEPIMGVYSIPAHKILFEPQFIDVDFFLNGLLRVEVFDPELGRNITKIIDRTGNELFPSEYTFIWEHGDFYKVTIREKDMPDRNGIIDKKGNVILPCKYDIPFNGSCVGKRLFIFQESGKQGIRDFDEKIIVPAMYEEIHRLDSDFLSVRTGVKGHSLYGLILPDGSSVLPVVFNSIDVGSDKITAQDENGSYIFSVAGK
jgi:hypothetical protein